MIPLSTTKKKKRYRLSRASRIVYFLFAAVVVLSVVANFLSTASLMKSAQHRIAAEFDIPVESKKAGAVIDILSVASNSRPEHLATQKRTWANHPLVRNFFNVTEDIDDWSCQNISLTTVLRVPKWCKKHYLTSSGSSSFSWVMQRYTHFYASVAWLKSKPNPAGWLCAQKRFPIGLSRTLQGYAKRNEPLPDYFLVVDDDTYYNMDVYFDYVVANHNPHDPFVGAGCRVTNGRSLEAGVVFPFGGFGLTFSRASLERLLLPLHENSPSTSDWGIDALEKLYENLLFELPSFRDGMSLAVLMENFAMAEPFGDVTNWTRGYCFHGHWVLALFTQLYRLHSSEFMHAIQDSEITLQDSTAGPQYTNLCKNEYGNCTSSDLVCHYQTPQDMERLVDDRAKVPVQVLGNRDVLSSPQKENMEAPMIVVKSRFMQFQPRLLALGKARLQLFETFCLPTLVAQSTNDFLWLIRIDPDLTPEILVPLKAMVEPYKERFFLIKSNDNTEGFRTLDVDSMTIVSGEKERLREAISRSQSRWLLEMRLDADDGLHKDYLKSLRQRTTSLQRTLPPDSEWRAFCVSHSINWHSGALSPLANVDPKIHNTLNIPREGLLFDNAHLSKSCITPGLSYLLPPHVQSPPIIGHHVLHNEVPRCNSESSFSKSKCLEMIQLPFVQSVQARTPTSHGMGGFHREYTKPKESALLWRILNTGFNITEARTTVVIADFKKNIVPIAKDNLDGQCTEDHTCSRFAKRYLERIIWNKENEEG